MKTAILGIILVGAASLSFAQDHQHSSSSRSASHESNHSYSRSGARSGPSRGPSRESSNRESYRSERSGSFGRGSEGERRSSESYRGRESNSRRTGEEGTRGGFHSYNRDENSGSRYTGRHENGFGEGRGSRTFSHTTFNHDNFERRVTDRSYFRPSGAWHERSWFEERGWRSGPAFVEPSFSCYVGYCWSYRPASYDVVWILDPDTDQYYEAYYYPQYGYYAWASRPLVAIGVYSPSIAFCVRI